MEQVDIPPDGAGRCDGKLPLALPPVPAARKHPGLCPGNGRQCQTPGYSHECVWIPQDAGLPAELLFAWGCGAEIQGRDRRLIELHHTIRGAGAGVALRNIGTLASVCTPLVGWPLLNLGASANMAV